MKIQVKFTHDEVGMLNSALAGHGLGKLKADYSADNGVMSMSVRTAKNGNSAVTAEVNPEIVLAILGAYAKYAPKVRAFAEAAKNLAAAFFPMLSLDGEMNTAVAEAIDRLKAKKRQEAVEEKEAA